MKPITFPTAILLCTCATWVAAQRYMPPGVDVPKESAIPRSESMRLGVERRVQRAKDDFAALKMQKSAGTRVMALISLPRRVGLDEIREVLNRCECDLEQLHRSVGEMQISFPAGVRFAKDLAFEANVTSEYTAFLEFRLNSLDAERAMPAAEKSGSWWQAQEYAAMSKALAEARKETVKFNGLLVSGTVESIECVGDAPETGAMAIEPIVSSRRPFAIPLETYRRVDQ